MDVDPVVASVAGHRRSPDPVTVSHLKGPLGALLARRLVGKVEDARAESLRIHELQGLPNAPVLEVALPATHDHGMDHEPKLVEWVLAQQRPDEGATAYALDLIGERWALLVVRELLLGPKRFTDLRAGLPHASPNVLAQRLRELESAGVVRRRKLPPPAASRVYELTGWGMELEPVIIRLGRWGARSPSLPRDAGLGVDSLILSLRTMFDPRAAEGIGSVYELRLGEDRFRAEVADGRF